LVKQLATAAGTAFAMLPPQIAAPAPTLLLFSSTGEDIVAGFRKQVNDVVEHLIVSGVADPARIAVAGTSRGGFMAFHAAAGNPRIRVVAAFAPVTDLIALSEFAGQEQNPLVRRLALLNAAEKLADRAAWIMIGDHDECVGTDHAAAFAKALTQAAAKKKLEARVDLHVVPVPGHASFPEWHDQAARWFLSILNAGAHPQITQHTKGKQT